MSLFQDSEINKQTIVFLKNLLVDDPHNINTRLQLASLYLQNQELDKAGVQISFAAKLQPNNTSVLTLQQAFEQKAKERDEEACLDEDSQNELLRIIDQVQDTNSSSMLEKPKTTFKEVGGMQSLKEEIRLGIIYPFQKPDLYAKYGKKIGGGILLYGPPGCGKTFIARSTAGEINANFISVGIEEILDMYIGESEKNIHKIFEEARRNKPTVLFFDEIDALSMDRMKTSGKTALVNQFLTEMDGISGNNENMMIIGATNAPWNVDPAFKRPGRFDKIIFVEPPDKIARAEIFKLNLENKPIENIDYLNLAEATKLYSGADIAKVCDMAVEIVMREVFSGKEERNVGMKDLQKAIKETSPSIKEWLSTAKNFARFANESGNYSAISDFLKKNNIEL